MVRLALVALALAFVTVPANAAVTFPLRSLDGSGNNVAHPEWGKVGTQYTRVAPASYADGISTMTAGPPARWISNRIFNDRSQNLFSENGVTQWGFVWGQFIDHTIGLRQEDGGTSAPIAFSAADPLEDFHNDAAAMSFSRTAAAPGTGETTPREQLNTESSYIDAFSIYGGTTQRLEWLRKGPVDGRMNNNGAKLLLPGGFLPRRDARGDAATAPQMDLDGRLLGSPSRAAVAGDVRANENIALTATQTLFAREHNRIVDLLPDTLDNETKFELARRIVGAEEQYITYNEFLPALGITLPPYTGYDASVNTGVSNEFAVVGYRAHSMIHGEFEAVAKPSHYSPEEQAALLAQGVELELEGRQLEFVVPLNVAFFNPDVLELLQLGPVLGGIGAESEYRNDEQIDNQLRSVLFQVPAPGNPACLDGPTLPACFHGVTDLAAIDIERGRDHGMPGYNSLRAAYGLAPKTSFTAITGEATDSFPVDPLLDPLDPVDDPHSLDFVKLLDRAGNDVPLGSEEGAVTGLRRTTLAARLKATYGSVDNADAFVGMVSEAHVPGTEFGELQAAIWRKQFQALRDGDRFFYANDPALADIESQYGISYRHTLGELIQLNTGQAVAANVFKLPGS